MDGAGRRNKGAAGERELANLIGAKKISRSGYTGPDLEWHGRFVEVKRQAKPISGRIEDLLQNAQIVIERGDRLEWTVHLKVSELLDLRDFWVQQGRDEGEQLTLEGNHG